MGIIDDYYDIIIIIIIIMTTIIAIVIISIKKSFPGKNFLSATRDPMGSTVWADADISQGPEQISGVLCFSIYDDDDDDDDSDDSDDVDVVVDVDVDIPQGPKLISGTLILPQWWWWGARKIETSLFSVLFFTGPFFTPLICSGPIFFVFMILFSTGQFFCLPLHIWGDWIKILKYSLSDVHCWGIPSIF